MKKINYLALLLLGAGFSFISCEKTEDKTTSSEITEITGNMTLSGSKEYIINQELYLDNAELIIEPGCTIKFGPDGMINVGYTGNAAIIANGTAEKPIIFKNANSGTNWIGIRFYNYASNRNMLRYCRFDAAGRNNYHNTCIAIYNSKISMFKCTIENSSSYGIYCDNNGGFVNFDSNLVKNCGLHPMHIDAKMVQTIGNGNIFETTANFGIEIIGQSLESGTTINWKKQTLPYFVEGSIDITNNTELIIESGTVFKMKTSARFDIGWVSNGKIRATGTITQPIIFTSAANSPTHGNWEGIFFYNYTMGNSILEYCEILYAGFNENTGNLNFYGTENQEKVTVKNCRIAYSNHYGVYFGYGCDWGSLSLLNLFDNNLDGDIYREE